ncbi:hypothetical protein N431DRAFT_460932 [Stipitochalara longipes BDJ]|nr:hypothetical protein N431DRAFT_460932 [Stipitochalara longipes BDJ]
MKSFMLITALLSLAFVTTAAPALQKRWCHPVCCCDEGCVVDTICDSTLIGYVTYCCEQDLETATPVEIAILYAEGTCIIEAGGDPIG